MFPFLSYLGLVGLISLAVASATLKTRKYVPSVQDKDVWPKWIYQTVEVNRMPSVRLKIVSFYCRIDDRTGIYFSSLSVAVPVSEMRQTVHYLS